jgi:hypothetical protein
VPHEDAERVLTEVIEAVGRPKVHV